jgi:2-oxoglutarate decarboxylase
MSNFGPNDWLVDEMYEQYKQDPKSVSESWRDYFADYRPDGSNGSVAADVSVKTPPETAESTDTGREAEGAKPIRGAAARIVANMEASLAVPTATSVRAIPAKLLIDNRVVINNHLRRGRGGKVSFTHLIGYALVKAVADFPVMNRAFSESDGKPAVSQPEHVNLGLAIDIQKDDGTRTLVVPNIKNADSLDFARFWSAYEDVVRKARTNKLTADDFAGTTISLTNPGR